MIKLTIQLLIFLLYTIAAASQAVVIYVYEDKTGIRTISNRPLSKESHTLIKTYEPQIPIQILKKQAPTQNINPRKSKYDKEIFRLADTFGQDRLLMKAIVHIESNFNPKALSNKGAQGLMQLMPLTAQSYDVNKPYDVVENLRAGIQHFSVMMEQFNQNIELSLAAYNAGALAVNNYQGIPPYPETKAYVNAIMQLHKSYQRIAANNIN